MAGNLIVIRDERLLPDLSASEFEYEFNFPHVLDWANEREALHVLLLDGRTDELKAIGYCLITQVLETDDRDVYLGDPYNSLFFSRSTNSQPTWERKLNVNQLAPLTIFEAEDQEILAYLMSIERAAPRKLGAIEHKTLSYLGINLKGRYTSPSEAEKDAEYLLRRRFTFDEIYYSAYDDSSQTAFSSIAKAAVSRLLSMEALEITGPGLGLPNVDAKLHGFRDSDFLARTFSAASPQDTQANARKLERAEAQHQRILEDVFKYLDQEKHQPKFSSSIDIAIVRPNLKIIFEVKSATVENFQSQLFAGLIQVLSYAFSISSDIETSVVRCLVIEKPHGALLNTKEIEDFCKFVDCSVFFWDSALASTERFSPLHDIIARSI